MFSACLGMRLEGGICVYSLGTRLEGGICVYSLGTRLEGGICVYSLVLVEQIESLHSSLEQERSRSKALKSEVTRLQVVIRSYISPSRISIASLCLNHNISKLPLRAGLICNA